MNRLGQPKLHSVFLDALGYSVRWHSDIALKPLEIDLTPPLPERVRLYLYNLTHPPGGRTKGEHKIQLIVPGQRRGERATFDSKGGRIVLLSGFEPELQVFVFWDAVFYPEFSFSRNLQVKPETVFAAYARQIAMQNRQVRGIGTEVIVACTRSTLSEVLQKRVELTRSHLMKG